MNEFIELKKLNVKEKQIELEKLPGNMKEKEQRYDFQVLDELTYSFGDAIVE